MKNLSKKLTGVFSVPAFILGFAPQIVSAADESKLNTSFADGLLYTGIGLVITFLALIFISLVIMLFKYINKAASVMTKNTDAEQENEPVAVNEAIESEDASEEVNDEVTVAAVTAAVMAYVSEQGDMPANGLVVRSIKRAKKFAW